MEATMATATMSCVARRGTVRPRAGEQVGQLASQLPALRDALREQRGFRRDQLAQLAAEERAITRRSRYRIAGDDPTVDPARHEVSLVLAAAARRALADIESALERMRSGGYGLCVACAQPIDLDRLAAVPQTAMCMRCQRDVELGSAAQNCRTARLI
jgi:DnaK suppressor protein